MQAEQLQRRTLAAAHRLTDHRDPRAHDRKIRRPHDRAQVDLVLLPAARAEQPQPGPAGEPRRNAPGIFPCLLAIELDLERMNANARVAPVLPL